MIYDILPAPKPRMTQRDKFKKRPPVIRYRAFCDHVRLLNVHLPQSGARVTFVLPMPKSWSKKKRDELNGMAHTQKPDLDNLLKALADAVYEEDAGIWDIHARKVWGRDGLIEIVINENHKGRI